MTTKNGIYYRLVEDIDAVIELSNEIKNPKDISIIEGFCDEIRESIDNIRGIKKTSNNYYEIVKKYNTGVIILSGYHICINPIIEYSKRAGSSIW